MRSMEEAMPDDLEKTLMRYAVMLSALLAGWAIGYSEWNKRVSGSRM
jgi:hypothetical protein